MVSIDFYSIFNKEEKEGYSYTVYSINPNKFSPNLDNLV